MAPSEIAEATRKTKVLIVDDHPAAREGLAIRIGRQSDLEVCGEAADAIEALHSLDKIVPDVAVIDISLRASNGIDLIKRIKSRSEEVRMLVWSMHPESLYADRALRAGALGYVNKENATEKIIEAIRQVRAGKMYLSEQMSNLLLNRAVGGRQGMEKSLIDALSDRELEAFELIGQGLTTQQVAVRMKLSPKTIETYRDRIRAKLNLPTGSALVHRAVQWVIENS